MRHAARLDDADLATEARGAFAPVSPGKVTLTSRLGPVAQARGAAAGAQLAAVPASGGAPLPGPLQARMDHAFGADFSDVRVHIDGQAEQIGAQAFATGTSLHFAAGQYDPGSEQGQSLIAHELTHVVQQRGGRVAGDGLVIDAGLEREADEHGARAARGEVIGGGGGRGSARGGVVQGKDAAPLAPAAAPGAPPALVANAGQTFSDDGGYQWRIERDGSFTCTGQPPTAVKKSIGAHVMQTNRPDLWHALCQLALTKFPPAPAAAGGAAPAPSISDELTGALASIGSAIGDLIASIGQSIGALASALVDQGSSGDADGAAAAPGTVAGDDGAAVPGPGTPAASRDVRVCVSGQAIVRDDAGKPVAPPKLIPKGAYVNVVESKPGAAPLVRVELLSSQEATSGSPVGWTSPTNLAAPVRPKRPTSASAQMAALLSTAQSNHGAIGGQCYHFVKHYINDCGGYGDILDIYSDERFVGFQTAAVDFAAAVAKCGAAALGLQEVSGLPMGAQAGTLLVTRGNGQINLSEKYGDIAVIQGVEDGCVICINDGVMKLSAKAEDWSSGKYAGVLVGMYRPIDRT